MGEGTGTLLKAIGVSAVTVGAADDGLDKIASKTVGSGLRNICGTDAASRRRYLVVRVVGCEIYRL